MILKKAEIKVDISRIASLYVCVCMIAHDELPMNDPVLQIRLKKQLSGGRVPHLLQERVHRNKSARKTLNQHTHTAQQQEY